MARLPAAVLFSVLIVMLGCTDEGTESTTPPATKHTAPVTRPSAPVEPSPTGELSGTEDVFVSVVENIAPSVVNISTYQSPDDMLKSGRLPSDNFHKRPPHGESSVGTGVIYSEDGYILTNAHVVADSTEITVKLYDETELVPELVGADPKTDIAVLKVKTDRPLTPAPLGDSDKLRLGQWAIALGTPFGLEKTVTVGVVSGVGRADVGVTYYENFIQTDASINPGNSGGPLCNSRGEVIGITTAIMSAGQGISFAIPVNMAKDIAAKLIEQGEVVRGWLGVGIQALTPELADGFGVRDVKGVLVNKVFDGSPAEKAKFRVGDVITSFDGIAVDDVRQLQNIVGYTEVGKKVQVVIMRSGRVDTLTVRIGDMEKETGKEKKEEPKAELEASGKLGITVHKVAADKDRKGVVIVSVDPGSNAERAGVQVGGVIVSINMKPVTGLDDFRKITEDIKQGDDVVLLTERDNSPLFIAFEAQ